MNVWFAGGGTGGHLYPGLAIARSLVAARPDVVPFFVGAQRGIEREVLPAEGVPHALLDLHPLYRRIAQVQRRDKNLPTSQFRCCS
jgi:UDP-N-acetylglucosamine--N-acetylmuramyl-(pentapeptide) pyrophosphoryl-undecaprenol N-acetylglucosamine transferase